MKLQNAYDTISDPEKRRAYDTRWPGIRDSQQARQESERRQAEAAETERKRATEESVKKQREDNARQERLRPLEQFKSRYDSDIFELSRVVRRLSADLKRLQDQDDEDLRKEKERNSWWAYLASPIYGKVNETDEQKQAREAERLHRVASKSIKVSELNKKNAKLQALQDALQTVNSKIAAEKTKAQDEARAQAREWRFKMEQEARSRAQQEMHERFVKAQKEQAERAAKEAREAQAAREAWEAEARKARETREAQERVRKAAAAERFKREAEERARRMRAAEEAARKAQQAQNDRSNPTTPLYRSSCATGSRKSTCRHDKFWPKVEGKHLCSNCQTVQRRFAFQCPSCKMIACANCRQTLRGEMHKSHRAGRRFDFHGDDDDNAGSNYCDFDY